MFVGLFIARKHETQNSAHACVLCGSFPYEIFTLKIARAGGGTFKFEIGSIDGKNGKTIVYHTNWDNQPASHRTYTCSHTVSPFVAILETM